MTNFPELSLISQTQPEPNNFVALSENSFLNDSKDPKSLLMAYKTSSVASPLLTLNISKNKL